jgi:RND family efflux transporter MFP subunit
MALAGLLCAVSAGCHKTAAAPAAPPPPEVFVAQPVVKTITDFEETTGRLAPVKYIDLRARVGGYLDSVEFKDGEDVTEGQRLFQIDPRPFEAALAQAKANVKQLETRHLRTQRQEERLERLKEQKFTTAEELELTKYQRMEIEAELEAVRAAVQIAELNLEYTLIKSPITGRISRRMVDPGNLIKIDDTPLATIVALDPLYAYFDIDERTVLQLRRLIAAGKLTSPQEKAIPVQLALADDDEDFTLAGIINFEDNQLSGTTGTLRLRADIDNSHKLLSPGMFVRIRVPIGEPHEAVLIQEEALGSDQGQRFVYILNSDDEVEYRRIKAGRLHEGLRVVESGLTTENRVIVKGLQRVRPGLKVTPKPLHEPKQEEVAEKSSAS